MKILLITQYYLPQPLANAEVIGGLATALGADGHDVTVVSPVRGATATDGVHHRRAIGFFPHDRRSIVARLAEYASFTVGALWSGWRAPDFDVVVVAPPPLASAVVALRSPRRTPALVYNVRDLYPEVAALRSVEPRRRCVALQVLARWVYRTSAAVQRDRPAVRSHDPPERTDGSGARGAERDRLGTV